VSSRARAPLAGGEAARLARAVLRSERVAHAALSITFVGRRRIRTLNRRHLGHDRDTDVIALQLTDAPARGRTDAASARRAARAPVVGDVYVCVPVGAAQARRYRTTAREELRRLVVHGVLHVLGWDHPDGQERTASPMWRRQERLLARPAAGAGVRGRRTGKGAGRAGKAGRA